MSGGVGETPTPPYLDAPPPVAELDRSLALRDNGRIVATAGIYSRSLTIPGAVVPCAGVTWVTVAPTHRRRGVLTAIMRRQLTEIHEQQREPVAALWASEYPIYGRFGYAPAPPRAALSGPPARLRLRPDVDLGSGRVDFVDEDVYRPAAAALHDVVRRFVPGNLARDDRWWDRRMLDRPAARRGAPARPEQRRGATARRYLLHTETDGTVTGYAAYRLTPGWTGTDQPDMTLTVEEVRARRTPAYASLWQGPPSVDLVGTVRMPKASPDDPLRHLVTDGRALTGTVLDALWVRLVDV